MTETPDKKGTTTMPSTVPRKTITELDAALSKFTAELQKTYGGVADAAFVSAEVEVKAPEPFVGKPSKKDYFRPSGERYIPRRIKVGQERFTDVAFVEKAYAEKMAALFYGPPGTGKTALIEAALPGVITIQGTVETESADFVGSWVQQPDGTYGWVNGPLLVAALDGKPLLIDEVALIDPRSLAVVYGAMDGRGEIVVTANPDIGTVKVQPGFLVFGATNPDVPGAIMSEALLSRFTIQVEMMTDWSLAKKLGIPDKIVQVARNLENKAKTGEVVSAPQLRELLAFRDIQKAFGESVALNNFISQIRVEDQKAARDAVQNVFGIRSEVLTF